MAGLLCETIVRLEGVCAQLWLYASLCVNVREKTVCLCARTCNAYGMCGRAEGGKKSVFVHMTRGDEEGSENRGEQ